MASWHEVGERVEPELPGAAAAAADAGEMLLAPPPPPSVLVLLPPGIDAHEANGAVSGPYASSTRWWAPGQGRSGPRRQKLGFEGAITFFKEGEEVEDLEATRSMPLRDRAQSCELRLRDEPRSTHASASAARNTITRRLVTAAAAAAPPAPAAVCSSGGALDDNRRIALAADEKKIRIVFLFFFSLAFSIQKTHSFTPFFFRGKRAREIEISSAKFARRKHRVSRLIDRARPRVTADLFSTLRLVGVADPFRWRLCLKAGRRR